MKIHEYQGKAILKEFGVPVPAGTWPTPRPRPAVLRNDWLVE
jgi:succinyl-CoA synthetase beta subunit